MLKKRDRQGPTGLLWTAYTARGREILASLPPDGRLMVLIGRPYNSPGPGMKLNLHRKLRQLECWPCHGLFARGPGEAAG